MKVSSGIDNTKKCTKCRIYLPLSAFGKHKISRGGIHPSCKKCNVKSVQKHYLDNIEKYHKYHKDYYNKHAEQKREFSRQYYYNNREATLRKSKERRDSDSTYERKNLLKRYGISLDEYSRLLESQEGTCAICFQPETKVNKGKLFSLAVDHDHATGAIRGLLCCTCNRALGLLGDNIQLLTRAVEYLEQTTTEI